MAPQASTVRCLGASVLSSFALSRRPRGGVEGVVLGNFVRHGWGSESRPIRAYYRTLLSPDTPGGFMLNKPSNLRHGDASPAVSPARASTFFSPPVAKSTISVSASAKIAS